MLHRPLLSVPFIISRCRFRFQIKIQGDSSLQTPPRHRCFFSNRFHGFTVSSQVSPSQATLHSKRLQDIDAGLFILGFKSILRLQGFTVTSLSRFLLRFLLKSISRIYGFFSGFTISDADVRLARRIRRDTGEKGRDIRMVLDQYSKFVKPAFDDFILPTKKYADILIPRGGDNHVAIDLIVQHIRTKLGQHDLCKIYPNLYVIHSTFQIRGMHTLIRDAQTTKHDFVFYADRLIRLVVEHGLGHLPFTEMQVITPTGSVYTGVDFCKRLCGVSVIRSGESMENALRACCKGIKIGKILIHREGDNGQQLIYEKLPQDISDRHVLLLDPILGTGNSAVQAISLLLKKGVPEGNIIFLNLISAPQGVHVVCKRFPRIKIVTSEIETGLNEEFRVLPGMGEFGDRYFGTDDE